MNSSQGGRPRRASVQLSLVAAVLLAVLLANPSASSAAVTAGHSIVGRSAAHARVADGRAAVPPVPALVIPLSQGINTDGALPITARVAVVADVGWLQDRLAVTLPRIHWTGPLPYVDGIFGASTTKGVEFFKTWANHAHALLHLPPLFKTADGGVGSSTVDILAIVAAYFQLHPGPGSATLPENAGQEQEILLLNQDRTRVKVPPVVFEPQVTGLAQSWANKMAAAEALSFDNNLNSEVTDCVTGGTENVGVGGDIPSLETLMLNGANWTPPLAASPVLDPTFNAIGLGVAFGNDGGVYMVLDFVKTC